MGERADEMRDYSSPATPEYTAFLQRDTPGDLGAGGTTDYDPDPSGDTDTGDAQTEMLKDDIEQTRAEMARTVDEIQARLNPQVIVEQVKETAKEKATDAIDNVKHAVHDATVGRVENMVNSVGDSARETGSGLMGLIKENPVPAALAGLGLGWLYMKRQNNPGHSQQNSGATNSYSPGYSYNYPAPVSGNYSPTNYKPANTNNGLVGKIMENPIPAAIAGVGIGYIFMKGQGQNNASGYSGDAGQNSSQGLGQVKDKVGEIVGTAGQKAGDITGGAGDVAGQVVSKAADIAGSTVGAVGDVASGTVHKVGDIAGGTVGVAGNVVGGVQQGAQKATSQLERMLQDNPLAVGGVAIALGAVIGMMLPGTERENQIMGKAHDTLMGKAGEAVQETMSKVSSVAGEVTNTVKEEAKSQGLTQ